MRVLIVDDSISACKSVGRILMDQAVTYCCTNGLEWAKHYNHDKPDIIMLDIMMPGISGVEVLKQIRTIDKDIPVIMVSAIDDKDQIIECLNLGANGYITKPISSEKIISSVKRMSLIGAIKQIAVSTAASLVEFKKHATRE